jgi:hypothetical protein
MTDSTKPKSPAEASREGLAKLDQHAKHGSTAHTSAPHPIGKKFDETASEVYRGASLADEKK